MFTVIFEYLPYLFLAILFFHITAITVNIAKIKEIFDINRLLTGLFKSLQIVLGLVLFTLVINKLIDKFGITEVSNVFSYMPDTILISGIVYYMNKGISKLIKLLGLEANDVINFINKKDKNN